MALYTSLVDIWSSRPDLRAAFPQGTVLGTPDNKALEAWKDQFLAREYPGVTLVPPGDSRIQPPASLTREAQAGQAPAPSAYQPAGQPVGTPAGQTPVQDDRAQREAIVNAYGGLDGLMTNNGQSNATLIAGGPSAQAGVNGQYYPIDTVAGLTAYMEARAAVLGLNTTPARTKLQAPTPSSMSTSDPGFTATGGTPSNDPGFVMGTPAARGNLGITNLSSSASAGIQYNRDPQTGVITTTPNPSESASNTPTTGNPEYDSMLQVLRDYLTQLQAAGQVVNPALIELNPGQLAEFLKKAEGEIDPYYAGQLQIAREDLLRTVGYSKQQIIDSERALEQKYGRSIRNLAESAADRGFALSGIRGREEGELAQDTQEAITSGRRTLGQTTETAARKFAQSWGGTTLPTDTIGEAPTVAAGQAGFQRSDRALPTYQISDSVLQGLVGSEEYNRRAAVAKRTAELTGTEQGLVAARQQRDLLKPLQERSFTV